MPTSTAFCGARFVSSDGRRFQCVAPPHPDEPRLHYFRADLTAPSNATLESSVETYFQTQIRALGGMSFKLAPTHKGMPDRLVIFPVGRVYLVELKAVGGRVSEVQKHLHARMAEKGVHVVVLTGREEVREWLRKVVGAAGPTFRKTADND